MSRAQSAFDNRTVRESDTLVDPPEPTPQLSAPGFTAGVSITQFNTWSVESTEGAVILDYDFDVQVANEGLLPWLNGVLEAGTLQARARIGTEFFTATLIDGLRGGVGSLLPAIGSRDAGVATVNLAGSTRSDEADDPGVWSRVVLMSCLQAVGQRQNTLPATFTATIRDGPVLRDDASETRNYKHNPDCSEVNAKQLLFGQRQ